MRRHRSAVAMVIAVAALAALAALAGCAGAAPEAAVTGTRAPGAAPPTTAPQPTTTAAPLSPSATIGFPALGDDMKGAPTSVPPTPPTTGRTSAGGYLGPLTFSWPAGCRVPVTEAAVRDDSNVELTYTLVTAADPEGLLLSFADVLVTTVGGSPVPAEMRPALAAQFALPQLVVDVDGSVLAVRGAAEAAAALRTAAPDAVNGVTDTEVADILTRSVTNVYWNSWISAWLPFSPIAKERSQGTYRLQLSSTVVDADIVVESLPVLTSGARLRQTTTLDSEALLRAVGTIPADADAATVQRVLASSSGSRVATLETAVDPATMRPVEVTMRTEVTITTGGSTQQALELRRWTLDWSTAGC